MCAFAQRMQVAREQLPSPAGCAQRGFFDRDTAYRDYEAISNLVRRVEESMGFLCFGQASSSHGGGYRFGLLEMKAGPLNFWRELITVYIKPSWLAHSK